MSYNGAPSNDKPDKEYPDPGKYTPDDLGEKKVFESEQGRYRVSVPPSTLRHLDVEEGDKLRFNETDDENKVMITKLESDEEQDGEGEEEEQEQSGNQKFSRLKK